MSTWSRHMTGIVWHSLILTNVLRLGNNDLALSSGPYSYGYALASSRHNVSRKP